MKAKVYLSRSATKGRARVMTGSMLLTQPSAILALQPTQLGAASQVVAELPDGSIEPLVWILNPAQAIHREYQYDSAVMLPKGTRIVAPQGSWRIVFR